MTSTDDPALPSVPAWSGWLTRMLPKPPARILDAGCGTGALARALSVQGYEVTAIDIDPAVVMTARETGVAARCANLIEHHDEPYDAVVCSLSLHHMHPLLPAIDRAAALVARDGILILDEFAWDRADKETAHWFYNTAELLAAAELLDLPDTSITADPLMRWQAKHADHTPGEAMVEAVSAQLTVTHLRRTPYLASYLGGMVKDTPTRPRIHEQLERIERDRIERGSLKQVGFQLVAKHERHN